MQELLSKMTLKEKVGQLNQRLYGWQVYGKNENGIYLTDYFKDEVARFGSIGFIYGVFRADPWSGKNQKSGLSLDESKLVSHLIQTYIHENTRLKIPVFLSEECPHGHQALDSITTPANITVGASWNPELYQEIQETVAEEIREKGAHLGLISTLDVMRDPRWGRTEECFSEDPFLTSCFTRAAVLGLQGSTSKKKLPNHCVLTVLKHLAAQGASMGGHNAGPVNIGERELREIHLPAMYAGIDAGAQLMMAAYNDIDGIPCHMNHHLLTQILRKEAGYSGAIMADGCGLDRLSDLMKDKVGAAAVALNSGVDISLWDNVFPYLEEAVLMGLVSEETLDQAVLRVLMLKEKMGLFDKKVGSHNRTSFEKKRHLVTQIAEESIVLLKNNHVLPINKQKPQRIAVIGPHVQNIYHQLGDYTPFKDTDQCSNIIQGLEKMTLGSQVECLAEAGCEITQSLQGGVDRAIALAQSADKIILTIGSSSARDFSTEFDDNGAALSGSSEMTSGENIDMADLRIPHSQRELLNKLADLGKPIIGIVISGRPLLLKELEIKFDALLFAGYPGQFGGDALARLLFGEVSPSGKLAMSIPDENGQLPVYYNYRDAAFKTDYMDISGRPLYEFGYGLSYGKFSLSDVAVFLKKQNIVIRGKIENESQIEASEVIQVYLSHYSKNVIPRKKVLCGFKKIKVLPQNKAEFEIILTTEVLQAYDVGMKKRILDDFQLQVEITNQTKQYKISNFNSISPMIGLIC